jgi:hypothetical protein
VNSGTLHRIDIEFLAVHHHKVLDVMIIAHPHPLEGIQVIFLGVFMEGGIAVPLEGVIGTVNHNLIGIQVRLDISLLFC